MVVLKVVVVVVVVVVAEVVVVVGVKSEPLAFAALWLLCPRPVWCPLVTQPGSYFLWDCGPEYLYCHPLNYSDPG